MGEGTTLALRPMRFDGWGTDAEREARRKAALGDVVQSVVEHAGRRHRAEVEAFRNQVFEAMDVAISLLMTDGPDTEADDEWLADAGFKWSPCGSALVRELGGRLSVVCSVADRFVKGRYDDRVVTTMYLEWKCSCAAVGRSNLRYVVADHPTRAEVERLILALGEKIPERAEGE